MATMQEKRQRIIREYRAASGETDVDMHKVAAWAGPYAPPTKESRTQLMRARVESVNAPSAYDFAMEQLSFMLGGVVG